MKIRTILAATLATAAGLTAVGEEVAWTDSTSLTITKAVTNTFDQVFDPPTSSSVMDQAVWRPRCSRVAR